MNFFIYYISTYVDRNFKFSAGEKNGTNVAHKKAKTDSSGSSDESSKENDSSEEPNNLEKAPQSDSSSDSDSSDEESEVAKPAKPIAAAKIPISKGSDSDSESDSSSSSSQNKSIGNKNLIKPAALKKSSDSDSDSSSSSDSSDDDDDEPVVKQSAPVQSKESDSDESESSSDDESVPETKNTSTITQNSSTPTKENKIYVKGLPWSATETEVKDFFKSCGKMISVELPLSEDGRSSGTAYIKFTDRSGVDSAIALDGQVWPGTERWLKILESFDKPDRKTEVGEKPEGCDTVFVGNLSWDVTEEQMRELFSQAGEISSVRFANAEDGTFRGFGHVSFFNGDDTSEAVKLAGQMLNGRSVRVDYAPPRNRDSFGGGGRGGAGRGRGGGRDSGRGGRGRGGRSPAINKGKGTIAVSAGKKMTFD